MRNIIRKSFFVLLLLSIFFHLRVAKAFFWDSYLVKINGHEYSKEDYLKWWQYWKEPKMNPPKSPDSFINWVLLSNEGKRLALDEDASYKHKLRVFLEVRSLLLLKNEEVDSKIDLSRERLWKEYVKNYVPRLRIKAIFTKDQNEMNEWKKKVHTEQDFEKLYEKLQKVGKAKDFGWERPITIPKELRQTVLKANPNSIVGPLYYHKTYFLLYVKEKVGPDKEDFKRVEREIAYKIHKKEEALLTAELLKRLKKKYNVKVYWDMINKIDLKPLPKDLGDKVVLQIQGDKLTAKQFQENLKREVKLRLHGRKVTPKELDKLKHFLINTYIAQTLTAMEAMNRHYENKPPLKDLFSFYKKQMLVNELKQKIIWPQVKVTEKEAKAFYEKHKEAYTSPEMVEIAVIKSKDPKLIREVYKRIKSGESFFDVGKEVQFHGVRPERFPLNRLVPEMRKAVSKLKPGDISPIIHFKSGQDNWYCIVYLIRHYPKRVHSFEMVKDHIIKMLKQQKFQELQQKYIEKLRARSDIKVNNRVWKELRRQLEAANGSHS